MQVNNCSPFALAVSLICDFVFWKQGSCYVAQADPKLNPKASPTQMLSWQAWTTTPAFVSVSVILQLFLNRSSAATVLTCCWETRAAESFSEDLRSRNDFSNVLWLFAIFLFLCCMSLVQFCSNQCVLVSALTAGADRSIRLSSKPGRRGICKSGTAPLLPSQFFVLESDFLF